MKNALFLLPLIFSMNSFAAGFICTEDMRDVEGMFKELQLIDTGNGHDLVYKTANATDWAVAEKKLAAGLTCNFAKDARISYCFKEGATKDTNSLAVSKRIEVTQVRPRDPNGAAAKQTYLYVDVASPDMDGGAKGEYRFLFSHCKAQ